MPATAVIRKAQVDRLRRKGWLRVYFKLKSNSSSTVIRSPEAGSPTTKVTLYYLTPRKLRHKLGLDTPLCSVVNHDSFLTNAIRQGTTSSSLKPKGLGGALEPPRGACPRTDNPRSTSPPLAPISLYTAVVSPPPEGPIVD